MAGQRFAVRIVTSALALVIGSTLNAVPAIAATTPFTIDCTQPVGFDITSPGTYLLRRAASNCGSDTAAIRVTVSDVVLDLQARAVDGDDLGAAGIYAQPGTTDVTVRNGAVSDFDTGVDVEGTKARITGLVVRSNINTGIYADSVGNGNDGDVISNNTSTRNGGAGISAGSKSTISNNVVIANSTGIFAENNNTIFGNTSTANGAGIEAGNGNTISENNATGNGGKGFFVGSDNIISKNNVSGNGDDGLTGGDTNAISGNRAIGNGSEGIDVNADNNISQNRTTGNHFTGIDVDDGNTITGNTSSGNGLDGMNVVSNNRITSNTTGGNLRDGIEIESPDAGSFVAGNTANDNGGWGIDAGGGPVRGGATNKAKDNGQVSQCQPVGVCRSAARPFVIDCTQAVGIEIGVPGTYLLRRGVANCGSGTAAIRVSASDVVLDLQGRAVDGDDLGAAGIFTFPFTTNVTIRNGTVSDFDTGVDVDGSESRVTGLAVRSSDFNGIDAAANNTISGNRVSGNGIGIVAADGSTISENTATGNDGKGISAGSNGPISKNNASGNTGTGISAGNGSAISGNRAIGNGQSGIDALDGNNISKNTTTGNGGNGIGVHNNNTISGNTVIGNASVGIDTLDDNTISGNTSGGNASAGIGAAHANTVTSNRADGNNGSGIEIFIPDAGTTVSDNTASGNVQWGIDAGAGPVAGGATNKAKDNGQALQCEPAGVCVAAPAGPPGTPFLIDCSQTVGFNVPGPGTYVLQRATDNCGSDTAAIQVNVSDVVLDLQGRAIDGDDAGAAGILTGVGTTNVKIRNGIVHEFDIGVKVNGTQSSVAGLTVRSSDTFGIDAGDGNTVAKNVAAGNHLGILAGDGNTIANNSAAGSDITGISAGDGNTMSRNVSDGNGTGIAAIDQNRVSKNTATGNDLYGIVANNANVVSGNRSFANDERGIVVNSDNTVSKNTTIGNRGSGIGAEVHNVITENTVRGNRFDGIRVDEDNRVISNNSTGNVNSGIVIITPDAGTTLSGNTANGNADWGIDAGAGPVRGGATNRAKDNGEASQCRPFGVCGAAPRPFVIDCTQPVGFDITVPGTYLLRRPVSDCGSDTAAIRVSVSNVVLDLQGRAVDGDDLGAAGILTTAAATNVTIRNGTISDFDRGVDVNGTTSHITGLTVRSSDVNGIDAVASATISRNTVSDSTVNGILAGANCTISRNWVTTSLDYAVRTGDDCTVIRNVVTGNAKSGILPGLRNVISRNIIVGNREGILGNDHSTISKNTLKANSGFGILGIYVSTITENVFNGNGTTGILANDGNTITNNTANGNGEMGISADVGNKVTANRTNGNLVDGIEILTPGPATRVSDNTANGNLEWGIDAGAGPVAGGATNHASDNGEAAQCRPSGTCA